MNSHPPPPVWVVMSIDEFVPQFREEAPLALFPPEEVFQNMFGLNPDQFVWQIEFHFGRRTPELRKDQVTAQIIKAWDKARLVVSEHMFYMLGNVGFPEDYVFHHWLSHHVAVFKHKYASYRPASAQDLHLGCISSF